ncbi:Heat shock protein DnaJ with tetratricopeptide repeat [Heracleum sosnowskyi]|uniref:Heat shock protein DnaJ with tetratricopeptide repeat n=1 Tax=Heracleum sosnowskyi TaxID=360622 RepID=A0AAD8IGF4_9APIA|nr:Heat shock protein DnaJ with tetratricopeptide repeat [Heracleum sosnowskyi]
MVDICISTMPSSPSSSLTSAEKKPWWLTNKKIVDKYVKDARCLIETQEQSEVTSALNLLDSALTLTPKSESALELKARSLLCLRRYRDVADMLQEYIPSLRMSSSDDNSSSSSSSSLSSDNSTHSRERVKLLSSGDSPGRDEPSFKCFSVSDLKKKVMAGICKSSEKEGQWRYLVLGQACCHLGLMEDAMVLLQTGKRMASAALRRESVCWSDDSFSFTKFPVSGEIIINNQPPTQPKTEFETITHLLSHIKLLLRRKTSAMAALDAGLYAEAIRHFSKIVDGRRGAPQGFLAECYMNRASAYRSAGRIAESLADCNRALALNPSCIDALSTRAALFETIRCLPDALHDLEHLKLLYNTILRDRKLPGPAWKRQYVHYREIPGRLCTLATKLQALKQRVASGETGNVDYYALIGLRRGCSRSELDRAHLLLTLRHKPDKSNTFIDRCQFSDEQDVDSIRDRARMSSLLLYRLIQKGYTNVMSTIMDDESMEKQRKRTSAALQATATMQQQVHQVQQDQAELLSAASKNKVTSESSNLNRVNNKNTPSAAAAAAAASSVFQGVFCRDLAAVGSLLSQTGFNLPIAVKYEALSC